MNSGLFIKCVNLFNDKLFILSDEENELFEYNINTKRLLYLGIIKKDNLYFCTSCIVNEKIYYFSYFGSTICIYDINENTIEYQDIKLDRFGKKFGCCSSCFRYDNKIFIFGGGKSLPLIEYNTEDQTVVDRSDWLVQREQFNEDIIKNTAYTNPCVIDDVLWIPTNIDGTILEYNLETNQYYFHKITDKSIKFFTINRIGNNILLSGNNDVLLNFNFVNNEIKCYNDILTKNGCKYRNASTISEGLFYLGYEHNGFIVYIPLRADGVYRIDFKNDITEKILALNKDEYCFWAYDLGDYGLLFQISDLRNTYRHTYIYHSEIREISFPMNEIDYSNVMDNQIRNSNMLFNEKYPGMFNWFIEALTK